MTERMTTNSCEKTFLSQDIVFVIDLLTNI